MSNTATLPFADGEAKGLEQLSGAQPVLKNFLVDAAGTLAVRPGIREWSEFEPIGSAVIGIYPWRQYVMFVTADRRIWALSNGNLTALSDASDSTTVLGGTGRPIWTFDADRVVVTGGGAPQQWQGSGLSSQLAPAATDPSGTPLALTHISYADQRFIGAVNSVAGFLQWTQPGPGGHTTWPITGAFYAEAETYPDPIVAEYTTANEVFAFGTQSTQVFIPDATLAFAPGAAVAVGCSAPYSIINTDTTFCWLDDTRRFVSSSGRNFDVLSSPGMAKDVAAMSYVADCWGCRIRIGSSDLRLWSFPTERRAIYFDAVTQKWGEWDSTDDNGVSQAWAGQSYCFNPSDNTHLIGLENGTIGELTFSAHRDIDRPIRAVSRTGFQDRDTFVRKACERIQLQLKRGATLPTDDAPIFEIHYRDDLGAFRPVKRFTLGAADYQSVVDSWSLGVYRTRQWQVTFTDAAEFVMTGAVETFSAGDS